MLTLAILAQLSLPTPLSPVLQLAQGFSGADQPPRCQRRGESGEDLGSPLAMFCIWASAGPGMVDGKLTARIGGPGGPTLIHWEVPFADPQRPVRLADSLGTYLRKHGFTPKTCGNGDGPAGTIIAVQWRDAGMAVHVAYLVPAAGYQAKLLVMATDVPAAIHPILCQ